MAGRAFVALLPFDIETTADVDVTPFSYSIGSTQIVVHWPFWHETSVGRRLRDVNPGLVPSNPGRPLFAKAPLQLHLDRIPNPGTLFADALRLDVHGDTASVQFATDTLNRFLRILRAATGQWWMTHPHRDGEGLVRAEYTINADGVSSDESVQSGLEVKPRFGIESPLSPPRFLSACSALSAGQDTPLYAELLYDAVFFVIERSDIRRSLLDACIACDMAILAEAIRAASQLNKSERFVRKQLSQSDMIFNLGAGLERIFGVKGNFRNARPDVFENIRRLWATRGSIAHGLAPSVGSHGRAELPDRAAAFEMLKAAFALIDWLRRLPFTRNVT